MKIGQLSWQMAAQNSSYGGFIGNTVDNPKNESCKAIELRNKMVHSEPRVSKEKKESSEVEKKSGKKLRLINFLRRKE